ncbi:hypothetical protein DFP73DRAFT_563566 [Morchella snyderi]|nr:hypothetical protein DFP73DRAFT_563566 [Morchella snyderi]
MAAPDQEQPDFQAMEETMNLGRMRNIPAFDGGAQILAELRAIREDMGRRFENVERKFENMELRLEAADYNAVARLTNSSAITIDSQLIPLRTRRNEDVEDFPMTQGDIDRLTSVDLNRLLDSYGLPTVGQIDVRRRQLKKYLGITATVI